MSIIITSRRHDSWITRVTMHRWRKKKKKNESVVPRYRRSRIAESENKIIRSYYIKLLARAARACAEKTIFYVLATADTPCAFGLRANTTVTFSFNLLSHEHEHEHAPRCSTPASRHLSLSLSTAAAAATAANGGNAQR